MPLKINCWCASWDKTLALRHFKICLCKLLSVKTAQTLILDWDYLKPCLWNQVNIVHTVAFFFFFLLSVNFKQQMLTTLCSCLCNSPQMQIFYLQGCRSIHCVEYSQSCVYHQKQCLKVRERKMGNGLDRAHFHWERMDIFRTSVKKKVPVVKLAEVSWI